MDTEGIYVFGAIDNEGMDNLRTDYTGMGYAVYRENDCNEMEILNEEFSRTQNPLRNFQHLLRFLTSRGISRVSTFHPSSSDTVCCHPYELENEEIIQMCEDDGSWYMFQHHELPDEEMNGLRSKGIEVIVLDEENADKINARLRPIWENQ